LNPRPPAPKAGALPLRHSPSELQLYLGRSLYLPLWASNALPSTCPCVFIAVGEKLGKTALRERLVGEFWGKIGSRETPSRVAPRRRPPAGGQDPWEPDRFRRAGGTRGDPKWRCLPRVSPTSMTSTGGREEGWRSDESSRARGDLRRPHLPGRGSCHERASPGRCSAGQRHRPVAISACRGEGGSSARGRATAP
jgi:hypothetical protein